jgi:oxepin-CoA hydrolase/3-oxo-5,6-dehydrosuberyl-CoA semialdehyde dehydrogenase
LVPKEGVAIHYYAFNFPVWGMLDKDRCELLAGVPAIVKPATDHFLFNRSSSKRNYRF